MIASLVTLIIVIGSSIWIAIDAHRNKISTDNKPYRINSGAVTWFFACLLFWIFVLPAYLFKRFKHLKAQGKNSILATVVGIILLAVPIMMFTGIMKMPTLDLQEQVKQSIIETWSREPTMANTQIQSFTLIHKSNNQYEGLLEVTMNGVATRFLIDVTYDGRKFMWQIRQ